MSTFVEESETSTFPPPSDEERNIQPLHLPGEDLDILLREDSEALRDGLHGVRSRS